MGAVRAGLCGLWILGLAVATSAADFAVGSEADAPDALPGDGVCAASGGACTLRAAIQEANALPGEDTVWLPAGLYTLTLAGAGEDLGATGDLDVTDGLVLVGEGSGSTFVDAAGLDRVFHLASPEAVELRGIAVIGGATGPSDAGAAILVTDTAFDNLDDALLYDVVVADNVGSGFLPSAVEVQDDADVLFVDSTIADNEGSGVVALGFFADLEFQQTTVHANAGDGLSLVDVNVLVEDSRVTENGERGIGADGDVYINVNRSTIGWNVREGLEALGYGWSSIQGSTIRNNGGVGLRNTDFFQDMFVHGSTITGNQGGGVMNASRLFVSSSTIARNRSDSRGGGVLFDENRGTPPFVFSFRNSIIAENEAPDAPDCAAVDFQGSPIPLVSEGGNLIGDASGCAFVAAAGDQVGSAGAPIDPRLAPLGDYGGSTETFALLPGSPALDAIAAAACLYDDDGDDATPMVPVPADQRGEARPQGGGCDVGAFEAVQLAIGVDVDPRSRRNVVKPFSRGKLEVALLGGDGFDPGSVSRETLRLGPGEAVPVSARLRDVDRDGRRDLAVRVRIEDTGIALGDSELCLAGLTSTGGIVSGCDAIRTQAPGPPPVPSWLELLLAWLRAFLGFFF